MPSRRSTPTPNAARGAPAASSTPPSAMLAATPVAIRAIVLLTGAEYTPAQA